MSPNLPMWSGLAVATLAAVYAARGVFGVRGRAVAAFVVIANIAAVLCTAWLALQAARTTENGLVWVLSAGSERDAGHRPLLQVVDIYPDREMSGVESLAGPDRLWLEAERRRRVAVAGWGLSREQLRGVGAAAIERFDAAPQPVGISRLDWPERVREGSPLRISGNVAGVDRGRIRVLLGDLELGIAATDPGGEFELDLLAPLPGRYVLDLQVVDENEALVDRGPLPLQVFAVPRLNVLALAASPSFSWRYLANWLSDNGAGLLLRTRVSQAHFLEQRHNVTADLTAHEIDEDTLAAFDIVVADSEAWSRLAAAARERVERLVRDQGLGLLLLTDNVSGAAREALPELAPGLAEAPPRSDRHLRFADWNPLPAMDLPALAITGAESLWEDEDGMAVAAFAGSGTGRIGLALRLPVYRWVTAGESDAYARYWQHLLAAIARPQPARLTSQRSNRLPFVGMRLELCFDAAVNPEVELIGPDAATVALPMYRRATGACALFWPYAPGWHGLRNGDETDFFYVYTSSDWRGLQVAERIAATGESTGERAESPAGTTWNLPPQLVFSMLLVILGLLWWEQKRRPVRLVKPEPDGA